MYILRTIPVVVLGVFVKSIAAFPAPLEQEGPWALDFLDKRQAGGNNINNVNQNQNVNNINIVTSAPNNTICTHGARRCTNTGAGGYNSTDLCNWNTWVRYQCPPGLMCVDGDFECVYEHQASWISSVYQAAQSSSTYCPYGLNQHGCNPQQKCIMDYNTQSSYVAAVTVPTQVIYSLTTSVSTQTQTQTKTQTATVTSTAACATQTVVIEAPCLHGSKKCTEYGVYTCVYGIWQGCLCDTGSYCIPHFYECLPFQPFVEAVQVIRNQVSQTVIVENQVVPYFQGFQAGPTVISQNQVNQVVNNVNNVNQNQNFNNINIVVTAPPVVSVSTSTVTESGNTTYLTWTTSTTTNWTSTTTWSTISTWTTTMNVTTTEFSTITSTESSTSSETMNSTSTSTQSSTSSTETSSSSSSTESSSSSSSTETGSSSSSTSETGSSSTESLTSSESSSTSESSMSSSSTESTSSTESSSSTESVTSTVSSSGSETVSSTESFSTTATINTESSSTEITSTEVTSTIETTTFSPTPTSTFPTSVGTLGSDTFSSQSFTLNPIDTSLPTSVQTFTSETSVRTLPVVTLSSTM